MQYMQSIVHIFSLTAVNGFYTVSPGDGVLSFIVVLVIVILIINILIAMYKRIKNKHN
jgi:uncharacterized membrane protein